ncbi:hypothetical protein O181_015342 [Austropuccinia psidii MF-1]|uniref:Uncharacterized protein n=1 Tax=Austropuccinia psidii MF-1 TaxID=1389203 RepID=A0A9Q3C1Z5_9BASI|nr:hypothetical protein [Austropuccinia psidii MF-1]
MEEVKDEDIQTEDYDSYSMENAIRENSDDDQDPIEENLVEYQEETQLEIKDIQLEAGLLQDTTNQTFFKCTQDAKTFLVTPTTGMEYIYETETKIKFCVDNYQHPSIIKSGAFCSIVTRKYFKKHFSNQESQLLPTKAKVFRSA